MAAAFLLYFLLLKESRKATHRITHFIIIAVIARFSFLACYPLLSDDVWRFLWDGLLWHHDLNPLIATPQQLMDQNMVSGERFGMLFAKMNSPDYYTVYPPIHQLVFYISTISWDTIDSIITMRALIIMSEVWTCFLLIKLLNHFKMPVYWALIYALNPLIIVELTGNLHFESFMISFLLASFLALAKKRYALSGALMACSIAVKLLPLMFVPAFFFYLLERNKEVRNKQKWTSSPLFSFFFILLSSLILFFTPLFIGIDIGHFLSSIDLYFQKFEFNASMYFVLRQLGIWITGYNQIAIIGPLLGLIAMSMIIWLSISARKADIIGLVKICLISFIIYLCSTTTVHPWYLALPIALSVFQPRLWIIVWSYLIVLSYSLYSINPIRGMEWLLVLEYTVVLIIWYREQKKSASQGEADFYIS